MVNKTIAYPIVTVGVLMFAIIVAEFVWFFSSPVMTPMKYEKEQIFTTTTIHECVNRIELRPCEKFGDGIPRQCLESDEERTVHIVDCF